MRYVQLRAFHYVATRGGFSRAAEALNLTQPAISDQVRKLETEFDVLLFDRSRKQVVLTPIGDRLLSVTRRMFETEQDAFELLSQSSGPRRGVLRLVVDSAHHLRRILPTYRASHPDVRITVATGNTREVYEALHAYEADLGIIGDAEAGPAFESVALSQTPILAFVGRGHALAGVDDVDFPTLARYPLVLREKGSNTRARVLEAADRLGIILTPAIEAQGREAVRELVASGAGVGFVAASEFDDDPRLHPLRLRDASSAEMSETLICLRERSKGPTVAAFLEIARSVITNTGALASALPSI